MREGWSFEFPFTPKEHDPLLIEAGVRLFQGKMLHRRHFVATLLQYYGENQKNVGSDFPTFMAGALDIAVNGEWFSFGEVTQQTLKSQAYRAVEIMGHGLLRMPYPSCVFHHQTSEPVPPHALESLGTNTARMQSFYCVLDGKTAELPAGTQEGPNREFPDGWFLIMEFRIETYHHQKVIFLPRLTVFTDYRMGPEGGNYRTAIRADPMGLMKKNPDEVNSVCDPVAVLNVILNTKNVAATRVHIDPKLNRARAKQGKAPLRDYTVIDTQRYFAAAKETERMGTHASPRMHIRRGHIRHLPDKEIWINDMIVNAGREATSTASLAVERDHYKVKS